MKKGKQKLWTSGLGILLLAGFALPAAAGGAKDEAAIRVALAAESKAYRDRDLAGTMAPYAEDVVVFDIMPPLQHVGYKINEKTVKDVFDASSGPVTVDFTDVHVEVLGPGAAYSRYFVHVAADLKDGSKIDLTARNTDIWKKRKGRWLIVHEESSVPVNMVTGKAEFKAEKDTSMNSVNGQKD